MTGRGLKLSKCSFFPLVFPAVLSETTWCHNSKHRVFQICPTHTLASEFASPDKLSPASPLKRNQCCYSSVSLSKRESIKWGLWNAGRVPTREDSRTNRLHLGPCQIRMHSCWLENCIPLHNRARKEGMTGVVGQSWVWKAQSQDGLGEEVYKRPMTVLSSPVTEKNWGGGVLQVPWWV